MAFRNNRTVNFLPSIYTVAFLLQTTLFRRNVELNKSLLSISNQNIKKCLDLFGQK